MSLPPWAMFGREMMGTEHRNHIHREKTKREKERKRAHTLMGKEGGWKIKT